jgi:hypothetical protein
LKFVELKMAEEEEEDTETKLAILSSIFTSASQENLFDVLIQAEGNVHKAIDLHLDTSRLTTPDVEPPSKRLKVSHETSPTKDINSLLKWTSAAESPRKVPSSHGGANGRPSIKRYIYIILTKSLH